MAIAVPAPRQALQDLRDAYSAWQIGRRTGGLNLLELDFIVDAVWRYWREGHPERNGICQRHKRWTSFELIEARLLEGGQIKLTCLEHCPGDLDLRGAHSILPHDFTVPRGRWSEIRELGYG
ncbi:MAG TPA: hypothetical protein VFK94_06015 [Patescibacteria group bacterium]|nr:hypothetical protein [Patescibacteria group bacterium]